jgi:hypothetical protein
MIIKNGSAHQIKNSQVSGEAILMCGKLLIRLRKERMSVTTLQNPYGTIV